MEFSHKLKLLRDKKGITQEELASLLYVSRTAVSKWESGKGYPSIDTLKRIAEIYLVSVDELLSVDELIDLTKNNIDNNKRQLSSLIYSLIDILSFILFFIPIYRLEIDNSVVSSSLFSSVHSSVPLILYISGISLNIGIGIINLIFTFLDNSKVLKYCGVISLLFSGLLIMFFLLGREPYPGSLVLGFLIIKIVLLLKK